MTTSTINTYMDLDGLEKFYINNLELEVLPTDIACYTDNAIYEENYIRSKSIFAFRSRYSKNKIIITLPISINNLAPDNTKEASSRDTGYNVLYQLTKFPYCFIKSSRVRSYIASVSKLSSTGYMMFAVDEINIVHDMNIPDVVFVEAHLLFNDHTPLAKDFKFLDNRSQWDDPKDSEFFNQVFTEATVPEALTLLTSVSSNQLNSGAAYNSANLPYGTVVLLAPVVIESTEETNYKEVLDKLNESNIPIKKIKVSSSNGDMTLTQEFFKAANGEAGGNSPDDASENTSEAPTQDLTIFWTAINDLSFSGISAVQSIQISLKNNHVPLYVGGHRDPIYQYMGKIAARLSMNLVFNTGLTYGIDEPSIIAAIGHVNNVLYSNGTRYPEAVGYNVLKIQSIVTELAGIKSIVPDRTAIRASAETQGQEVLTLNFVEADLTDLLDQTGKVIKGRSSNIELDKYVVETILNYINNIASSGYDSGHKVKDTVIQTLTHLANAVDFYVRELTGGRTDVHSDYTNTLKDKLDDAFSYSGYLTDPTIVPYIKKLGNDIKARFDIIKSQEDGTRVSGITSYLYTREQGTGYGVLKPNIIDAANIFKRAGLVDRELKSAYTFIAALAADNEPAAKAAMTAGSSNIDLLNASINSYSGYNIQDLDLVDLIDQPNVDAFYFLKFEPYFSKEDFLQTYKVLQSGPLASIDAAVNKFVEEDASMEDNKGLFKGLLDNTGVIKKEKYVVQNSEQDVYQNVLGQAITGASAYSSGIAYSSSSTESDFTDYNDPSFGNAVQQANKKIIREEVFNSKYFKNDAERESWTAYFIQIAGIESQLGTLLTSSTGAAGLMQLIRTTATSSSMGYTNSQWESSRTNPRLSVQMAIKLAMLDETSRVARKHNRWDYVFFYHNLGSSNAGNTISVANGNSVSLTKAAANAIGSQSLKALGTSPAPTRATALTYVREMGKRIAPINKYVAQYSSTVGLYPASKSIVPTISSSVKNKEDLNNLAKALASDIKLIKTGLDKVDSFESSYQKAKVAKDATLISGDGDTVYLIPEGQTKAIKYRLKYINTPEVSKTGYSAPFYKETPLSKARPIKFTRIGQPMAEAAKKTLVAKMGDTVWIASNESKETMYNRELTEIFDINRKDILAAMVQEGLAAVNSNQGSPYIASLKSYEAKAKAAKIGMWKNSNETPTQFSARIKKVMSGDSLKSGNTPIDSFAVPGTAYYTDTNPYQPVGGSTDTTVDNSIPNSLQTPSSTTNNDLHLYGNPVKTSDYGFRNGPNGNFHKGVDSYVGDAVPKVIAAADGIASMLPTTVTEGNSLQINHGNGFVSLYLHLKNIPTTFTQGKKVNYRDVIAIMGGTGSYYDVTKRQRVNYRPHLHQQTGIGSGTNTVNPLKTTSLHLIPSYNSYVAKNIEMYLNKDYNSDSRGRPYGRIGIYKQQQDSAIQAASIGNSARLNAQQFQGDLSGSLTEDSTNKSTDVYSRDNQNIKKLQPSLSADRAIEDKYSVFNEELAVDLQFDNMLYPYQVSLDSLIPVIKVYIVIGNENEDLLLTDYIKLNYYFELTGVSGLRLSCNNDDNPVDLLTMSIANPSFLRTDNYAVQGKFLSTDFTQYGTEGEISFVSDRVKLKPGMKLHIRAGYQNSPNALTTIFNGVITEMSNESGISLNVICEGYGRELLADVKSPGFPTPVGGTLTNSDTSLVIGTALMSEGISNFGRRVNLIKALKTLVPGSDSDDLSDPETKRLTTVFSQNSFAFISFRNSNYRQRIFSNIYSAEIGEAHNNFNSSYLNYLGNLLDPMGNEQAGYHYIMNGQTPWQMIKEMEFRHPGSFAKPLFYEDRMTMFFGIKEQMYIARDLDSSFMAAIGDSKDDVVNSLYLNQRTKRFDLVSRFHIISTHTNILTNTMGINNQYKTGVDIAYFDDKADYQSPDDTKGFRMEVDDDLAAWDYRYKSLAMPGCHGKYSAFMYGTTSLRKEAETMYGGKIVLIGNPKIKAGDYAYLYDHLRKLSGIIKVRECIHHFTKDDGFITEITPGQYVEAAKFSYSMLFLKLGFTAKMALAKEELIAAVMATGGDDFKEFESMLQSIQQHTENKSYLSSLMYNTAGAPLAVAGLSAFLATRAVGFLGRSVTAEFLTAASSLLRTSSLVARDVGLITVQTARDAFLIQASKTKNLFKINMFKNTFKTGSFLSRVTGLIGGASRLSFTAAFSVLKTGFKVAGSASRIIAGSLMASPIGWFISAVGWLALSYVGAKLQEAELTRQPLVLYPINYLGRPYTAGMNGYRLNSLIESLTNNYSKNWKQVTKLARAIEVSTTDGVMHSLAGYITGSYNDSIINTPNPALTGSGNITSGDAAKVNNEKSIPVSNPFTGAYD